MPGPTHSPLVSVIGPGGPITLGPILSAVLSADTGALPDMEAVRCGLVTPSHPWWIARANYCVDDDRNGTAYGLASTPGSLRTLRSLEMVPGAAVQHESVAEAYVATWVVAAFGEDVVRGVLPTLFPDDVILPANVASLAQAVPGAQREALTTAYRLGGLLAARALWETFQGAP